VTSLDFPADSDGLVYFIYRSVPPDGRKGWRSLIAAWSAGLETDYVRSSQRSRCQPPTFLSTGDFQSGALLNGGCLVGFRSNRAVAFPVPTASERPPDASSLDLVIVSTGPPRYGSLRLYPLIRGGGDARSPLGGDVSLRAPGGSGPNVTAHGRDDRIV